MQNLLLKIIIKYDHELIHFVKSFSSELLSVLASCLRQSNNKRMVNMLYS